MKRLLPICLTSVLGLIILSFSARTLAQTPAFTDDESPDIDDSAPVARVARLSFVDGDVSFLRAGVNEWAPAIENLPLLAGDQVYSGRGARAEIQLARGNYIRLAENSELTIAALSEKATQFEITEGTVIIRVERLSTAFGRFEVDTPNTAILIQQDGLYRVEVRGDKNSQLVVTRGEAEASTDEGTLRVREGHRALIDTANGRLELALDTSRDDWDQWSYARDNTVAGAAASLAPDYVATYETSYNDFYGADDLSSYGTWTSYSSYGQCWVPRVTSDWAPYRSGQWLWIPAAGWTWLSNERWGWAPYHYGRWAFLPGLGWAWVPGFGSAYRGFGYRDYHWRPALVYFFNSSTPNGHYVGWYPLAPGERWRRPDRSRRDDHAHLHYPSPRDGSRRPESSNRRGMTILPYNDFARRDQSSVRPAAPARNVSDWINRSARAGLPEFKPAPVAAAPTLAENERRSNRRLAVPPAEIEKRPVVTRNANPDSTALLGGARERRFIEPRKPRDDSGRSDLFDERSQRRDERKAKLGESESGSQAGTDRGVKRSNEANDDGASRERRRTREDQADKRSQGSDGASETTGEERRRARRQRNQSENQPSVQESSPGSTQPSDETRVRERRPPSTESTPREDSRPRVKTDDGAKSRDRAEAPRVEPRHEQPHSDNHDQTRQERRQEKQQERQQQQEQRRKP